MDRKTAVALRYLQEEDNAPKVVASGRGKIAHKIIEIAQKHGIPIYEDPEVVEILAQLEVGMEIAPELYEVIAEILAFVYSLDKRFGSTWIRGVSRLVKREACLF